MNSVSTIGVHLPLESPDQPEQRSHTSPFCGVDAIGQNHNQRYNSKFIRSGHPADSLSESLGSVYSNDSIRFFRSDTLVDTRSYISVYNYDDGAYDDASATIIDVVYVA